MNPDGSAESRSPRPHEPELLEQVRVLMGEGWTTAALLRLKEGIAALAEAAAAGDRAGLRHHAHRIGGEAGQLGFLDLSWCCADLERACRHKRDVSHARDAVRQSAAIAEMEIERLLRGG